MTDNGRHDKIGPTTRSADTGTRPAFLGAARIEYLWVPKLAITVEVPATVGEIVIGSFNADVVISDPHVSRVHAIAEHHGNQLHVRDAGSKNGTFVGVHGKSEGYVEPGARFLLGTDVHVVPLTRAMHEARWHLEFFLGFRSNLPEVSVYGASKGQSFLLVGTGRGLQKTEVARWLAAASPRAAARLVRISEPLQGERVIKAKVDEATRGMAYVSGAALEKMQAGHRALLIDHLFSPTVDAQVFYEAADHAASRLGPERIQYMQAPWIRTVARRASDGEMPDLIDRSFAMQRVGYTHRSIEFLPPQVHVPPRGGNLARLASYSWEGSSEEANYDELMFCVRYLKGRLQGYGEKRLAQEMDVSRSKLQRARKRWGLLIPAGYGEE